MRRILKSRQGNPAAGHVMALKPNIRKLKRITKRILSECSGKWSEFSDDEVSDEKKQFIEAELLKLETVLTFLDGDIEAIVRNGC